VITTFHLLFDSMAGYAFAKRRFPGKNIMFWLVVSTLTVPAQVIIPKGSNYAYFPVTGVSVGTANVTATAANTKPSAPVPVRISRPKFQVFLGSATSAGQKTTVTVYAEDSLGTTRTPAAPLAVTLVSSVPGHTAFDSATIHIPTNTYQASTNVLFDTAGTYTLTASAPGYLAGNATTVTTGAVVQMQSNLTFAPDPITIKAGQAVTWQNTSAVNHTTTSDASVWSASVNPGQSYSRTFSTAGSFPYHCSFHAGMIGTVVVNP